MSAYRGEPSHGKSWYLRRYRIANFNVGSVFLPREIPVYHPVATVPATAVQAEVHDRLDAIDRQMMELKVLHKSLKTWSHTLDTVISLPSDGDIMERLWQLS